jgi:hypothetical protein
MKVDAHHQQYAEMLPIWKRCEHAVEGQDAVHRASTEYLPKLKEQSDEDYKAYKLRASYFNAAGRTLDGLVGMIFRKALEIDIPASMEYVLDDIDLCGSSLLNFSEKIAREVLQFSRIGVLVEYPQVIEQPLNLASASQSNLRPYLSTYCATHIINWRIERVNNVSQPTMVALQESYVVTDDGFEQKKEPQIRVLRLVEGIYLQQIYRQDKTKKWVQEGDDIIPLINNNPLNFIPFYVFGASSNNFDEQMPVLLDLVDLNMAHYRVTADYEHGCHFAGLPTAVVAGYEAKENEKLYIGSATAWVFNNADAHASFLEFTGQGLGALENNLERKEKQMAAIGARMLEQQKTGVESEGAMQMRSNGETSVLAGIANMVSGHLSKVLTFMALWDGVTYDCKIHLNTDYLPVSMTSQDLAELVKSWQAGAISFETLFENLKRGEIVAQDKDMQDEQELIANAPITLNEPE